MNGDLSWPLVRASRLRPDAPGIVDGSKVVTYAELARRVAALGGALEVLGVGRGARVGILASNSLAHVECFIGVPSFGRVVVSLNVRLAEEELAFIVDDAGIAALLTDAEHLPVARALADRCSSLVHVIVAGEPSTSADCVSYERLIEESPVLALGGAESGLAAISYTGGTTGRPKGVMLTHDNLLANARHSLMAVGHTSGDRWLHVSPLFHVAGTANLLAATWVGATQVVLPRFEAAAVLRTIEEQRITHTMLVPTMLGMLLDHPARAATDLSSLSHLEYSASPIGRELQQRVLEALPCNVAQFYGMTEAPSAVTQLTAEDHRRGQAEEEPFRTRLRSTGTAIVGMQVEVRDDEGTALPPGELGEVWVRGPNVMLGYWQRPEATDAALIDGWYRTGDEAYADGEGYLFLVDRLKDMIITGGENVYSIEVEAALLEHPAVLEAAVFGIPDERWGEAVHAVVTVRPGTAVDGDELIAHCRRLIARFKVPRSIDVREEPLPRSPAGKTLKNLLRQPFWAAHDRAIG